MSIEKQYLELWKNFQENNKTIGLHCYDDLYKNNNGKKAWNEDRRFYLPGTKKEIIFTFRVTEYGVTCVTITYYLRTGMEEAVILHASKNACKPRYGTTWVGGGGVHSVPRGVYGVGGGISSRPYFSFGDKDGTVVRSEYVDGKTVKTELTIP